MKKLVTILLGVLLLVVPADVLLATPPQIVSAKDAARFDAMANAGKLKNYSLIPDMIAALQENPPPPPSPLRDIAHSLALLGALAAIPALDAARADDSHLPDTTNYIQVQIARLSAEASVRGIKDGKLAAKTKIEKFYEQLQLSPGTINEGVAYYNKNQNRSDVFQSVEFYAMLEVADMVYRGQSENYLILPNITQIDFSLIHSAALKVCLAPMSPEERRHYLIEDLAHRTIGDDADLTLALEQGAAIGPAAVAKLGQMDQHRKEYTQAGWENLFTLLRSLPDQAQYQELWRHFQTDADPLISRDARDGFPVMREAGY